MFVLMLQKKRRNGHTMILMSQFAKQCDERSFHKISRKRVEKLETKEVKNVKV